jgi:hypothetical protein
MRMENIFLKSSTNVFYQGYKVRRKIIPQRELFYKNKEVI